MAWTDPRTWTDGELVTAAIMNPHVRDDLNAIGPHVRLRKTADQSVTSSTALVDDTHLTFAIAANELWILQLGLFINSGLGGFRLQITGPAGATGQVGVFWQITGGSVAGTNAAVGVLFMQSGTTYTNEWATAAGVIVNGATPGNCRLQWAQSASNATASTIKQNSFLLAHRIG